MGVVVGATVRPGDGEAVLGAGRGGGEVGQTAAGHQAGPAGPGARGRRGQLGPAVHAVHLQLLSPMVCNRSHVYLISAAGNGGVPGELPLLVGRSPDELARPARPALLGQVPAMTVQQQRPRLQPRYPLPPAQGAVQTGVQPPRHPAAHWQILLSQLHSYLGALLLLESQMVKTIVLGQWLTLETQMSVINSQFCKMTKATDHVSLRTC